MIELRVLLGVAGQKEICLCPLEGVAEDAERGWSEGACAPCNRIRLFLICRGVFFDFGSTF